MTKNEKYPIMIDITSSIKIFKSIVYFMEARDVKDIRKKNEEKEVIVVKTVYLIFFNT